jgi:hypothetical protein
MEKVDKALHSRILYHLPPIYTRARRKVVQTAPQGHSSDGLLHKVLLQPSNLLLESLDLLPAVQRPPVVLPQARDNSLLRLCDVLVGLLELLPLFQLRLQLLDLLCDAVPAHVLLSLLLCECRAAGCGILDLLDERGSVVGLWGLVGEGLAELGKVLGFLVAHFLELGGQAFLVLEFLLF